MTRMKIVLAPDKFKGSLSAVQACDALEIGARRVLPNAQIVRVPLADGGEGTLDALVAATGGTIRVCRVQGPLGTPVEAQWGMLPDGTAVIEMAQATGLSLVPPDQRDALRASSYGTGQLIRAALKVGCRNFIIAIGGSASTDGGLGALSALGLFARDARGRALAPGGGSLRELKTIDLRFMDARLRKSHFTVLCDVTNPLYGTQGAAQVYGAQKGATHAQVVQLDEGLRRLSHVAAKAVEHDYSATPGSGAAGGIGFGLLAFCGAQLRSGIDAVVEATQLADKLSGASLVLTGEGALDEQTLRGKTVAGLCRVARAHAVPVIGFAGSIDLSGKQMDQLGLASAFSIVEKQASLQECVDGAHALLANSCERVLRAWVTASRI